MLTNQENGNEAVMREALEYAIARADEARTYLLRSADTKACMEELIDKCRAALSAPARNCDVGKDVRTLLEEYIAMRGFTSDNQIRALYELALPVIEWLLEPTEKMKGESRWKRPN